MRTKIVYVLVSQETDYYYEMLLLSLYSLRLHHPKGDAEVEVVMDEDTHQRLVDNNAEILNDVTPIVVPIPLKYTIMERSRYLKTQLRQFVSGDFLFLDCDTLICESINEIDDVKCTSVACSIECIEGGLFSRCRECGFKDLAGDNYYNSGISVVKDTMDAHRLFKEWHRQWLVTKNVGIAFDQPALCQANKNLSYVIQDLPIEWNCLIHSSEGQKIISKAKIIHYHSYAKIPSLARELLFCEIRRQGRITKVIDSIARAPKTIGFAVFSMEMGGSRPVLDYLFSDMLYSYCRIQPLYKLLLFLNRHLSKLFLFFINKRTRNIN